MQGRVYSATTDNVAVTTVIDFFEINPAVDKPVRLLALDIGQTNRTGDANEDMLRWSIVRFSGATLTSGSGGSTPTAGAVNLGDPAFSGTVEANNTTTATTSGTATTLHNSTFNTRVGLLWVPPPETLVLAVDSVGHGVLLVRLLEAPSASTTFSTTCYFEELG